MIIKGAFQFTPLREGRRNVRRGWNRQPISIHAPPRGATKPTSSHSSLGINFNSRPSARGDRLAACRVSGSTNFNSRPSARGDCCVPACRMMLCTFQFTPLREGRRGMERQQRQRWLISIHAPPRGATGTRRICGIRSANFNSRPSARGDQAQRQGLRLRRYFNSRPSARGDVVRPCDCNIARFQFTPLREGRPVPDEQSARRGNFNSRPSARGD